MGQESASRDSAVERVREALRALGLGDGAVRPFPGSTATAEAAARAVGCPLGAIVKSLLFLADGRPCLVLVPGDRQVDPAKLSRALGVGRKKVKMADPETVRRLTGYEVGGVPPLGHREWLETLVDVGLRRYGLVYAAAGVSSALFSISPEELVRVTAGRELPLARDDAP